MENFTDTDSASSTTEMFKRMQSNINTSIPCIVNSFDKARQTVNVKPVVQLSKSVNGKTEYFEMTELINVPVLFPGGAGFSITYPIVEGDECLVVFSQKSYDNWFDSGKVSKAVEDVVSRRHDLSDGIAIVGLRSLPNVVTDFSDTAIEIRNETNTSKVSIYDEKIDMVSPTINMTATDIVITGAVEITGSLIVNGINFDTHVHGGVEPGPSTTGVPQ